MALETRMGLLGNTGQHEIESRAIDRYEVGGATYCNKPTRMECTME